MKNIVLIGMSGVGKTTIGEALSTALSRKCIDTDSIIEEKIKLTINEIFSKYGEEYFRKLESSIIEQIYKDERLIISTGGGIVLNNNNIKKLREIGVIILLESSIDNIIKNIKTSNNKRPLLNGEESIVGKLKTMYNNRKELYYSAADFVIFVDNKSVDEIVYEILTKCVKINS